jgi:hypothetical protein
MEDPADELVSTELIFLVSDDGKKLAKAQFLDAATNQAEAWRKLMALFPSSANIRTAAAAAGRESAFYPVCTIEEAAMRDDWENIRHIVENVNGETYSTFAEFRMSSVEVVIRTLKLRKTDVGTVCSAYCCVSRELADGRRLARRSPRDGKKQNPPIMPLQRHEAPT